LKTFFSSVKLRALRGKNSFQTAPDDSVGHPNYVVSSRNWRHYPLSTAPYMGTMFTPRQGALTEGVTGSGAGNFYYIGLFTRNVPDTSKPNGSSPLRKRLNTCVRKKL
jgi:hypothetical protein